jgi:hypothetical protein
MKAIFFIPLLLATLDAFAGEHTSFNDSLVIGTWKGESICQVKSSPCHDEIAVYHISKGEKSNTFQFIMNKVVNGVEDMGVLDYTYDSSTHTLTSVDEGRKIIWTFKVKNETMEGTLLYNNTLYRVIKLNKVK